MIFFKVLRPGAGDRKHKALHKTGYRYRYSFILCILAVSVWCITNNLFTLHHQQFGQTSASVSCGQHRAPTCGKCPHHQHTGDWMGQPWCHGECKWHNDECLSQKVVEQLTFDFTKQVVSTSSGEKTTPNEQHDETPGTNNPKKLKELPPHDIIEVCDPRNFLVLIKAGAKSKYQERRKIWRSSSCPASYKNNSMKYHFMLAMPAHKIINPNGHNQAARANGDEIHDMERLKNESLTNNDMEFLPIKDVYEDFNLKVISMLRWAVDRGMNENTSMVVFHDDEYCLQPQVLQDMCVNATRSNSSLYTGKYLWKTPGSKNQKAFDGSFAPYFSGWLYALSSDLVRDIADDPETLFTSINVGYAEDKQAGTWVNNQAKKKIRPKKVIYIEDKSLGIDVEDAKTEKKKKKTGVDIETRDREYDKPSTTVVAVHEVFCGNHYALSCADCLQDKGTGWCSGDCWWSLENGGVCKWLSENHSSAEIKFVSPDTCEPVAHPELRPELIHIPKTGGTTLEIVGAIHNFTWGACHWLNRVDDMGPGLRCPKINLTKPSPHMDYGSIWHVPPKWMKHESKFWMNNAIALFTVVRDPYARAVSSWNYMHKGNPLVFNATAMNRWLTRAVTQMVASRPVHGTRPSRAYFAGGMLIPQVEYITKGIHVLHTETLERDFLCMMKGHGYHWEWPKKRIFNKSNKAGRLTVSNLTSTTRALIAKAYREDFVQFGYPLLKQTNSSLIQQQKVFCGGHYASSCDKCPHDINTGKWIGQSNCHGECKWLNNECQSEKTLEQRRYQEIQEQGTETKGDVGSLQNMCISNLQSCDLSCLDWAIVLSTGRSGSTTVQQMLSKLPGMNFYGEEGGLMSDMQHFQGRIENMANGHKFLSWHGSQDRDVRAVACMTQKLYAERHGQECNYRGCKHGWKEIRYQSAEAIGWLRTVFPSSRIILNYRSTCSDYKDIFGRDCKAIQEKKDSLLNATKDLSNIFHMELEQLNNKTKWHQLTKFLGYDGCEALNVTASNLKRGVTGKAAAYNPWSCQ